MKKAKSIAGLGQYALKAVQSRAIMGGATYSEVYRRRGGTEVYTYSYTDSNGSGMWDVGETRTLLHVVFFPGGAVVQ